MTTKMTSQNAARLNDEQIANLHMLDWVNGINPETTSEEFDMYILAFKKQWLKTKAPVLRKVVDDYEAARIAYGK